jgi:sRNA-binding carbon storage regulator CsrA
MSVKAGIEEPKETAVSREQLANNGSAATNTPTQQYRNTWKQCFLCGPYRGASYHSETSANP